MMTPTMPYLTHAPLAHGLSGREVGGKTSSGSGVFA